MIDGLRQVTSRCPGIVGAQDTSTGHWSPAADITRSLECCGPFNYIDHIEGMNFAHQEGRSETFMDDTTRSEERGS